MNSPDVSAEVFKKTDVSVYGFVVPADIYQTEVNKLDAVHRRGLSQDLIKRIALLRTLTFEGTVFLGGALVSSAIGNPIPEYPLPPSKESIRLFQEQVIASNTLLPKEKHLISQVFTDVNKECDLKIEFETNVSLVADEKNTIESPGMIMMFDDEETEEVDMGSLNPWIKNSLTIMARESPDVSRKLNIRKFTKASNPHTLAQAARGMGVVELPYNWHLAAGIARAEMPVLIQKVAESFGCTIGDVKDEQIDLYAFIHEIGHLEHLERDEEDFIKKSYDPKAKLLRKPSSGNYKSLQEYVQAIHQYEQEYRDNPTELEADNFAVRFISTHKNTLLPAA